MRLKTLALAPLLLSALLLAACAPHPSVRALIPGFHGVHLLRLEDNTLASPGAAVDALAFNLERVDSLGHALGTAALVEVVASPALHIRPDEPLRLRIDADTLSLPVLPSSVGRSARGARVAEWARYHITRDQLQRLASARAVRLRVHGEAVWAAGYFTPRNLAAVQTFLQRSAVAAQEAVADSLEAVRASERKDQSRSTAPPDDVTGR